MNSTLRLVILAVVAGLGAAGGMAYWMMQLESATRPKAYLALKENEVALRGTLLDRSKLESINLPASAILDGKAVEDTESNWKYVSGRRLAFDLGSKDMLLWQYFPEDASLGLSSRISPDSRAMAIPVSPTTAVANLIEPGSYVDVIALSEPPPAEPGARAKDPVAQVVLERIRVLATGTAIRSSPYSNLADKGYSTVTVEVTPSQATELAVVLARNQRSFTLLLRNPASVSPASPSSVVR